MTLTTIAPSPLIAPVLVLVVWSLIILAWAALARFPAMAKAKLGPSAGERTAELAALLDRRVQFKADNYNHLMEQPTIFYATCLALALANMDSGLNLLLAWFYVGSRVVHSFIHCTGNIVMLRFSVFLLGTLALLAMAVNGLLGLW